MPEHIAFKSGVNSWEDGKVVSMARTDRQTATQLSIVDLYELGMLMMH